MAFLEIAAKGLPAEARIGAMEAGEATLDSPAPPRLAAEVDRYLRNERA